MATTTDINNWPLPTRSDASNMETAMTGFANGVDARANPIFATTAARNAAIPSPTPGQEAFVTADNSKYYYNGSAWKLLTPYRRESTASGSVANFDFQNIPTGLTSLRINWTLRGTTAVLNVQNRFKINNVADTSYDGIYAQTESTGIFSNELLGEESSGFIGHSPGSTAVANLFSAGYLEVIAWNQPHIFYTSWIWHTQGKNTSEMFQSGGGRYANSFGGWNRVTLFPDTGSWATGSMVSIEGWDV